MSDTDMAYCGRKPCGCVVMAAVDKPEYAKDNAQAVADCVKRGDIIERHTVAEVRALPWARGGGACDHDAATVAAITGQESLL